MDPRRGEAEASNTQRPKKDEEERTLTELQVRGFKSDDDLFHLQSPRVRRSDCSRYRMPITFINFITSKATDQHHFSNITIDKTQVSSTRILSSSILYPFILHHYKRNTRALPMLSTTYFPSFMVIIIHPTSRTAANLSLSHSSTQMTPSTCSA